MRGVIVTGAGPAFCAGMDLAEMLATSEQADRQAQWHADSVAYHELIETMLRFPKPLVAAVNGPAVAGGAGMVMACDLVVAARSGHVRLSRAAARHRGRHGRAAVGVSHRRRARRVPAAHGRARSTPTRPIAIGLFHELVADDKIWARANELVGEIAQSAPEAMQMTKRLLNETIGEQLLDATGGRRRRQRRLAHHRSRRRRPGRLPGKARAEVVVKRKINRFVDACATAHFNVSRVIDREIRDADDEQVDTRRSGQETRRGRDHVVLELVTARSAAVPNAPRLTRSTPPPSRGSSR